MARSTARQVRARAECTHASLHISWRLKPTRTGKSSTSGVAILALEAQRRRGRRRCRKARKASVCRSVCRMQQRCAREDTNSDTRNTLSALCTATDELTGTRGAHGPKRLQRHRLHSYELCQPLGLLQQSRALVQLVGPFPRTTMRRY